ncbi:uncharacterized protein CMU_040900 [Cryptosporidium muris RN66]|uniref:Uncharacterized protein n=1 Tax=Cryptosporidium muris (strain RN66) TaxID=441375 RepID=B6A9X9_CRYMR|nr:uncharacterized protein CMU_040900 [Cryptosporidium muris RN66]EEA05020.1 hypothetical protein, conserved [Cryptosporidium muris RN66]|eukprot:XP_002139369.1 hypothetical protein [Cryptosporidium muris RN66]
MDLGILWSLPLSDLQVIGERLSNSVSDLRLLVNDLQSENKRLLQGYSDLKAHIEYLLSREQILTDNLFRDILNLNNRSSLNLDAPNLKILDESTPECTTCTEQMGLDAVELGKLTGRRLNKTCSLNTTNNSICLKQKLLTTIKETPIVGKDECNILYTQDQGRATTTATSKLEISHYIFKGSDLEYELKLQIDEYTCALIKFDGKLGEEMLNELVDEIIREVRVKPIYKSILIQLIKHFKDSGVFTSEIDLADLDPWETYC